MFLDPEILCIAIALRFDSEVCVRHMCCGGRMMDAKELQVCSAELGVGIASFLELDGIDRGDDKRTD